MKDPMPPSHITPWGLFNLSLPTSEYFLAFASFSPRIADLLTAGTEIFSLRARDDMVIPSSLAAQ